MTSFLVFVLMVLIFANVVTASVSAYIFTAWPHLSRCAHRSSIYCSVAFILGSALYAWILLTQDVPTQAIVAIILVTIAVGFFSGRDEAKQKFNNR
jgi:hypothetical protein